MVRRYLSLFLVFLLSFFAPISMVNSTYALSRADLKIYAQNNIMFIDEADSNSCIDGDIVDLGDNVKTALNYLISKGYKAESAAAIVGNLIAESGVNPTIKEGGELVNDPSFRVTEWEKFGKRGFGIAQWTDTTRQTRLQEFADQNGLPVISMEAQLAFLYHELDTGVRGVRTKAENMNANSFEEATFIIYRYFETPRSSFCTSNDKDGCYNNYAPSSYASLSPTETSSAFKAFGNRLRLARSALAKVSDLGDISSLGSSSSITCNGLTPNSEAAQKLVDAAIKIAWPNQDGYCESFFGLTPWKPRSQGGVQACSNTLSSTGKQAQQAVGGLSLRDCGKFVGAAVIYSAVDPDFPKAGVRSQMAYMNSSNKWMKVSTDGQEFPMTSLQPGDVLAYSAGNLGPTAGHIFIWIGEREVSGAACENGKCKVNIASASYTTWTPSLNYLTRMSASFGGSSYPYSVYRLAADPSSNPTSTQTGEAIE